ncbi:MAG: hypothetical protein M3291_03285 [Actinomycetota bacterium]|nr:hypothetical protein [Actinomycetota bacterium]
MTTAPGRTGRRIALAVAVVGALLVTASLLASTWSELAGDPVPRRWSGETLYLTTDRTPQRCTVSPDSGPDRVIEVADSPTRGTTVVGARLAAWFEGGAELTCTGEVQATSGLVLLLYPLGERGPWIIISGAALFSAGWVYSRPRRSR